MPSGPTLVFHFNFLRALKTISGVNSLESSAKLLPTLDDMYGQYPLSVVKTLVKNLLKISYLSTSLTAIVPSGLRILLNEVLFEKRLFYKFIKISEIIFTYHFQFPC